jgi:hypothetical protein
MTWIKPGISLVLVLISYSFISSCGGDLSPWFLSNSEHGIVGRDGHPIFQWKYQRSVGDTSLYVLKFCPWDYVVTVKGDTIGIWDIGEGTGSYVGDRLLYFPYEPEELGYSSLLLLDYSMKLGDKKPFASKYPSGEFVGNIELTDRYYSVADTFFRFEVTDVLCEGAKLVYTANRSRGILGLYVECISGWSQGDVISFAGVVEDSVLHRLSSQGICNCDMRN